MKHIKKYLCKTISIIALAALLLAAVAFLPTRSVSAATETLADENTSGWVNLRLERRFRTLVRIVENMQDRQERTPEFIAQVNEWIAKAQEKGIDTTEVEAALSAFETAVTNAQPHIDTAEQILSTHAGFNTNGKVIDRQAAIQTLKDAGDQIHEARYILRDAANELIHSLRQLRKQLPNQ